MNKRRVINDIVKRSDRLKSVEIYPRQQKTTTSQSRSDSKKSVSALESRPSSRYSKSQKKTQINTRGNNHIIRWILIIITAVIVAVIIISTTMHKATVTLVPQVQSVVFDEILTAVQNESDNDYVYETVTITESIESPVDSLEKIFTETKASGQITIYNEEPEKQRLIEETRFRSPDGYIYKLAKGDDIFVPSGSKSNPGKLTATVYADKPGPEYNITEGKLLIPGWIERNDSRQHTQYAVINDGISGGFSGYKSKVSDTDFTNATSLGRATLEERLRQQSQEHLTPDRFAIIESDFMVFSEPKVIEKENGATVSVTGELSVVVFNRSDFEAKLAKNSLDNYGGENISIANLGELELFIKSIDAIKPENSTKIEVQLRGRADFVYQIESTEILPQLTNISKSKFNDILAQNISVSQGVLSVTPFWLSSTPKNTDKIQLIIN